MENKFTKEDMLSLLKNTISNYENDVYDSSDLISTLGALEEDYSVKSISLSFLSIESGNIRKNDDNITMDEILKKYYDDEFVDDDIIDIFYAIIDDISICNT